MATKLYVGNLSFDATEEDVAELFTKAGEVQRVELIKDRESGRPRGFGFVTMADEEEARAAISQFEGFDFNGRSLTVKEARGLDSSPRGSGSGSGNRDDHRDRRPARGY